MRIDLSSQSCEFELTGGEMFELNERSCTQYRVTGACRFDIDRLIKDAYGSHSLTAPLNATRSIKAINCHSRKNDAH